MTVPIPITSNDIIEYLGVISLLKKRFAKKSQETPLQDLEADYHTGIEKAAYLCICTQKRAKCHYQ